MGIAAQFVAKTWSAKVKKLVKKDVKRLKKINWQKNLISTNVSVHNLLNHC